MSAPKLIFNILFLASLIYTPASLSLVEFQAGDVATAENFNSNFSELKQDFNTVSSNLSELSDITTRGFITATVNGVEMKISANGTFFYIPYQSTNIMISIDGYPLSALNPYFTTSNCTGDMYLDNYYIKKNTTWLNPTVSSVQTFYTHPSNTGEKQVYYPSELLTDLYYKSRKVGDNCIATSGNTIAQQAILNNSEVTGVSFPMVITGIGKPIVIDEVVGLPPGEIPDPVSDLPEVFANGVNIGQLKSIPNSAQSYLHVQLHDFDDDIYLYKDGTFSGFGPNVYSKTIHYSTPDCSGIAYVSILTTPTKYWWDASKDFTTTIKNNGSYYSLSSEAYKFIENSSISYKYATSATCRTTTANTSSAYKKATITESPNVLVIEPPITVEGWSEPTPYDELPLAD